MKWLHRINKTLEDLSPRKMEERYGLSFTDGSGHLQDHADWITDPDMSPVVGEPSKYWVLTGDVLSVMNQTEKDVVDATALTARRDSTVNSEVDDVEGIMRQVIKLLISELNILRAEHGLPDRTLAQLKTQIRNGLGS